MVNDVLDPGVVRVPGGRSAVLPPLVVSEAFTAPVAHVESRVGEDEVRLEVGVEVLVESVSRLRAEVGLDASDGEVHLGQPPRRRVGLLAKDRNVPKPSPVLPDERLALDEHATRSATRVVHTPLEGLDHLHEEANHAAGGVELATLLALAAGELPKEVLVDPAEDV